EKLADGDPSTKWLAFQPTATLTFTMGQPATVTHYALTSANDAPERDPKDWTVQGSADGNTWTTLDTQTGQMFTDRGQSKDYSFTNGTAYKYYRLNITANAGGVNLLQLAEFTLSGGVTVSPGASLYAVDATINGPLSATGAKSVVLLHTTVTGLALVSGTTDELSVEDSTLGATALLVGNSGGPLVSANRIGGTLNC